MHPDPPSLDIPAFTTDEVETLLGFLDWKRAALLHTARDLTDEQARWRPDGRLLPIAGLINHLTHVEMRWIDRRYLGEQVPAADPDVEFATQQPLTDLIDRYCSRRVRTNDIIRSAPSLDTACVGGEPPIAGLTLRWALLHVLDETAQHAGHADATRELLDGARSTD